MPLFGAPAVGAAQEDGDIDLGSGAVYQYYHTPWVEVRESLGAVATAGYDAIQVPPAQRSKRTWADPKPRGYQPIDHLDFDSAFGTETEYRAMVEQAHEHGLVVIADAVVNHMAEGVDFEKFPHFGWGDFRHRGPIRDDTDEWELQHRDLEGLPDLRQESEHVRGILEAYVQKYAEMGVDGIRWDAVKHIPAWFFREHANPWAAERGLFTVGEVLHGAVATCEEYLETDMTVMDYPLYFTMHEKVFHRDGDFRALEGAGLVDRHSGRTVTFVSNHDSPPPEYEKLAHAFILTYEGYPRVYSGRFDPADETIARLLSIRRNLAAGRARTLQVDRDTFVFEREGNLLVGLNRAGEQRSVRVETSWNATRLGERSETGEDITTDADGVAELSLPPTEWVCYAPLSES
ncbi:alpha-amylase family glycosyl hydrolase [Halorhabdus amylolytica]|uniref:alpha-amylase family glycosyl hydrolase n=1 Tax=Halorhabdus amylolytica TaxID=2559573 RepID=UPI0010AA8A15|nr:alpha-amylase family glycosyl hydrolase [Halorhabdus amylolytica]